jgi:predicted permease
VEAFTTIIPIFMLIGLGWFACQKGFVPAEFQAPANLIKPLLQLSYIVHPFAALVRLGRIIVC